MDILTGSAQRERRLAIGLSQAKLAEITGIRQHLLSAFELGKIALSDANKKTVLASLANNLKVDEIVSRKKRYVVHEYADVPHLSDRVAKHRRSAENLEYCNLLESLERRRAGNRQSDLSALSLFSGCGGFTLGFAWAGIRTKGFLELEPDARLIYKTNFPDAVELGSDITSVTDDDLIRFKEQLGQIDILIGGPPCQGFSLSGKRDVNDPRNSLFRHYLRFVNMFRPKVAVMENVRLLCSMKLPNGNWAKDEIRVEFRRLGYQVAYFEINAKHYGVPQHRERVLFVAVRDDIGIQPSLPAPTFGEDVDLFGRVRPFRSFADACSDLEYLESGDESQFDQLHKAVKHPQHVLRWLWNVPEGASAHENLDPTLRPPSGYNTTYKRQVWLEPAGTVQTTFGMISGCKNVHPIATRSLTIREAARLQSFPDSFKFGGGAGAIRTCIGNAVPPLLAYDVASHLAEGLLNLVEVPSLEIEL